MRRLFRRRQQDSRDDNATVKSGETPTEWEKKPVGTRQRYKEARCIKKHGSAHFGYKNLISIDWRHNLVPRYSVSSAAVHDSQKLDKPALATAVVQGTNNTASGV